MITLMTMNGKTTEKETIIYIRRREIKCENERKKVTMKKKEMNTKQGQYEINKRKIGNSRTYATEGHEEENLRTSMKIA